MSKRSAPFTEEDWKKVSKARPSQAKAIEEKKILKDSTLYNRLHGSQVDYLFGRINRVIKETPQGCFLSDLPLDQKGGYPKSLRLKKNFLIAPLGHDTSREVTFGYNAAAIVLVKDGKQAPDETSEASHLCEHPWCVNAAHILWETRQDNGKRKNCNTRTTCTCGCNNVFNPCRHTPACLDMTDCPCFRHLNV